MAAKDNRHSARSEGAPSLREETLQDHALARRLQDEKIEIFSPEDLSSLSVEEILNSDSKNPLAKDLNKAILAGVDMMEKMNEQGLAIPPDKPEDLAKAMFIPGVRTILLKGRIPGDSESSPLHLFGWSRIFTDPEHFLDRDKLPDFLRNDPDTCRADRLFLNLTGKEHDPFEGSYKLVNALKLIAGTRTIIGLGLVDKRCADIWLKAMKALNKQGFRLIEDSEHPGGIEVTFEHSGGIKVPVKFRWITYKQEGFASVFKEEATRGHAETLKALSRVAASFPTVDGKILCYGPKPIIHALAAAYPGNQIVGVDPSAKSASWGERIKRYNLEVVSLEQLLATPYAEEYDGILLDSCGDTNKELLRLDASARLKKEGRIIISGDAETRLQGSLNLRQIAHVGGENPTLVEERTRDAEGRSIGEDSDLPLEAPPFLKKQSFLPVSAEKEDISGRVQLIWRPNQTIDVVPYQLVGESVYLAGKKGFPRPLTTLSDPSLDRSKASGYNDEQLSMIVTASREYKDTASREAAFREQAADIARIRGGLDLKNLMPDKKPDKKIVSYSASPAMVDEDISVVTIRIRPTLQEFKPTENYSKLSASGRVGWFEGKRLLHACQTGQMHDPRLERTAYELMSRNKLNPGLWLGSAIELSTQEGKIPHVFEMRDLLKQTPEESYRDAEGEFEDFFTIKKSRFVEENYFGEKFYVDLEYALPEARFGTNTVPVFPVMEVPGVDGRPRIVVGLEMRDFPALEDRHRSQRLVTIPTFKLQKEIDSHEKVQPYLRERMGSDFGVEIIGARPLGGSYFSSPGCILERMNPYLAEVSQDSAAPSELIWVDYQDLLKNMHSGCDGQVLTAAYRFGHGKGLFGFR